MNHSGAINEASNDDPLQTFREWQKASAIRRVTEARGDDHRDIVRLEEEVVRPRTEDIVRHITLDDVLLREKDHAGR